MRGQWNTCDMKVEQVCVGEEGNFQGDDGRKWGKGQGRTNYTKTP